MYPENVHSPEIAQMQADVEKRMFSFRQKCLRLGAPIDAEAKPIPGCWPDKEGRYLMGLFLPDGTQWKPKNQKEPSHADV